MTNQRLSGNQTNVFIVFWVFLGIFGYFIIRVKLGYFWVFYHCCLGRFFNYDSRGVI